MSSAKIVSLRISEVVTAPVAMSAAKIVSSKISSVVTAPVAMSSAKIVSFIILSVVIASAPTLALVTAPSTILGVETALSAKPKGIAKVPSPSIVASVITAT